MYWFGLSVWTIIVIWVLGIFNLLEQGTCSKTRAAGRLSLIWPWLLYVWHHVVRNEPSSAVTLTKPPRYHPPSPAFAAAMKAVQHSILKKCEYMYKVLLGILSESAMLIQKYRFLSLWNSWRAFFHVSYFSSSYRKANWPDFSKTIAVARLVSYLNCFAWRQSY